MNNNTYIIIGGIICTLFIAFLITYLIVLRNKTNNDPINKPGNPTLTGFFQSNLISIKVNNQSVSIPKTDSTHEATIILPGAKSGDIINITVSDPNQPAVLLKIGHQNVVAVTGISNDSKNNQISCTEAGKPTNISNDKIWPGTSYSDSFFDIHYWYTGARRVKCQQCTECSAVFTFTIP